MLLWEALQQLLARRPNGSKDESGAAGPPRLPFDKRCGATTRSGKRCKGKIVTGSDYCLFHDPVIAQRRREQRAAVSVRRKQRLSHLPDGYLRKLTTVRSVGQAMDRLYREVRLGVVTPEMGGVMFTILNRLLESGLCTGVGADGALSTRTKAHRMRPRLRDLLTRAEKNAWQRAVDNAPAVLSYSEAARQRHVPASERRALSAPPAPVALTAAS